MNIFDKDFINELKQDILTDIGTNKFNGNLNISMPSLNSIHQGSVLGSALGSLIVPGATAVPGGILSGIIDLLTGKDSEKLENAQKQIEKQFEQRMDEVQNSIKRQIAIEQEKQSRRLEESLDTHLTQISNQINDIKQLLKSVSYSSDMIINSMGAANQRTSLEIIETQNLIREYMELIQSKDPEKDGKLKKFVGSLSHEVFICILSDVIKKLIGMP